MWSSKITWLALLVATVALAQRPSNESICDYYAVKRYGANTTESQYQLIQSIVGLAYVGRGSNTVSNAPSNTTGIFNQATFQGYPVYLRPWFDGSMETTNLNGQAVGVDWLDGGGLDPISAYINGSVDSIQIKNGTNQYHLFNHWFTSFGRTYGCTLVSQFPSQADTPAAVDVAYVHKFMNLNSTDVGYFINQFTVASEYYGFSAADALEKDADMNTMYNRRCAPAVNGKLESICLNSECPLAEPSPDCAAYDDIQPLASTTSSAAGAGAAPTTSPNPTSTSASSSTSSSSDHLTPGDIAGIAIGSAAVLLLAIGLYLYHRRRRPQPAPISVTPTHHNLSLASPPSTPCWSPDLRYNSTTIAPSSPRLHDSYRSSSTLGAATRSTFGGGGGGYHQDQPKSPQEMENTSVDQRFSSSSPTSRRFGPRARTPEMMEQQQYPIAEMESPNPPQRPWSEQSLALRSPSR